MWFYRRLLRVSWTEKRTNENILDELNKTLELLGLVKRRKMKCFGRAMRHQSYHIMKLVAQGNIEGKRCQGIPLTCYMDNITKRIKLSGRKYSDGACISKYHQIW